MHTTHKRAHLCISRAVTPFPTFVFFSTFFILSYTRLDEHMSLFTHLMFVWSVTRADITLLGIVNAFQPCDFQSNCNVFSCSSLCLMKYLILNDHCCREFLLCVKCGLDQFKFTRELLVTGSTGYLRAA